jgi:hypothetical protein
MYAPALSIKPTITGLNEVKRSIMALSIVAVLLLQQL